MSNPEPPSATNFVFASTSVKQGRISTERPRACDRCRRRKTRCEGKVPCAQCLRAEVQCTCLTPRHRPGRMQKKRVKDNDRPPDLRVTAHAPDANDGEDLTLGRGLGFGGSYGLHLREMLEMGPGLDSDPHDNGIRTSTGVQIDAGRPRSRSAEGLVSSAWLDNSPDDTELGLGELTRPPLLETPAGTQDAYMRGLGISSRDMADGGQQKHVGAGVLS